MTTLSEVEVEHQSKKNITSNEKVVKVVYDDHLPITTPLVFPRKTLFIGNRTAIAALSTAPIVKFVLCFRMGQ